MATPEDVLQGIATAMELSVTELTTALNREADPTDNTVEFPHGEILIISNIRANQWNTDLVGYSEDNSGNRIGKIFEAKFTAEFQLNIWNAVPSEDHDIQSLGSSLERGMRKYDSQQQGDPLPDGSGGTLNDVKEFLLIDGGQLETEETNNPPWRGYQISVEMQFVDRIDTAEEYGEAEYIAVVDTPHSGDLEDTDATDNVAIEYVPS